MKTEKPVRLNPEFLDKVWHEWLQTQNLSVFDRAYLLDRPYQKAYSGKQNHKTKFEDWLFECGASVRRIDKKYYLEFSDPKLASYFILRWT